MKLDIEQTIKIVGYSRKYFIFVNTHSTQDPITEMSSFEQIIAQIDIDKLILYTLFISAGIEIFYYLFFYVRITTKPINIDTDQKQPPVSIIICAKNEAIHLEKFIPKIVSQKYSQFEVIVVDDCSSDDTHFVLTRMANKYDNLRFTTIHEDSKFKHGKKLALTVGIKSAKYSKLLLTDADCYPESENWLKTMASHFTEAHSIVLGYGGFQRKKGLLDKLIRYDSIHIAQTYLSFAKAGLPYMGVGRNLAYDKQLFFENKGFANHYEIHSGDDDLFINEVATKTNTAVCIHPESFSRTIQKNSFKEWFIQKKRHITTSRRYSFAHKLLLGLEPISRILFYLSTITYFTYQVDIYFWVIIGVITGKELIQLTIFKLSMMRLSERNLLLYSLLFDIFQPIIYGLLNISNYATKRRNGNKS